MITSPVWTNASAAEPAAPLRLRTWSGPELDGGLKAWGDLEQRLGSAPLAASRLWTSVWINVYRDLIPSRIISAEVDGRTVAVALITEGVGQKSGPLPIRTRHLGTAGEPHGESVCVEYNGLLSEPAHRAAFASALFQRMAAEGGYEEFRLDGWEQELLSDWTEQAPASSIQLRDCPYFDLAAHRDQGGEPLDRLGRSTRQNLRRLLRKYGTFDTTWAENAAQATEIFEELVDLHQSRWKSAGQPGAFSSPRFLRFQRELIARGVSQGRVVLYRVRHQGTTVGCLLLLVDRGRLLDYVSGFASFEERPSPGLVTHYLCLSDAGRRGFDAYDFLVGEKRHKDNLSTDARQLAWASWRRATLRNSLIDGLRRLKPLFRRSPRGSSRAAGSTGPLMTSE